MRPYARILHLACAWVLLTTSTLAAVETVLTVGFHNRGDEHWAGGINAAIIGTGGIQNPLGDGTEPLASSGVQYVTVGSQRTERWTFAEPAITIQVDEWRDVHGKLFVEVFDTRNRLLTTLDGTQESYTVEEGDRMIGSVIGIGQVKALHSKGNAGGHVILTVTTIEVTVHNQASGPVADGLPCDYEVRVAPSAFDNRVTVRELAGRSRLVGRERENPRGRPIEFRRLSDDRHWQMRNARYYDNGTNDCSFTATWDVVARYRIDNRGTWFESNPNTASDDLIVTMVDFNGYAEIITHFSGTPRYTTVQRADGTWATTVTMGSFRRRIRATWVVQPSVPTTSQYYRPIRTEEIYHARRQMQNVNHAIFGAHYITADVLGLAQVFQPYVANTAAESRAAAEDGWDDAEKAVIHLGNSAIFIHASICALELGAKTAINMPYPFTYQCTYVERIGCPAAPVSH